MPRGDGESRRPSRRRPVSRGATKSASARLLSARDGRTESAGEACGRRCASCCVRTLVRARQDDIVAVRVGRPEAHHGARARARRSATMRSRSARWHRRRAIARPAGRPPLSSSSRRVARQLEVPAPGRTGSSRCTRRSCGERVLRRRPRTPTQHRLRSARSSSHVDVRVAVRTRLGPGRPGVPTRCAARRLLAVADGLVLRADVFASVRSSQLSSEPSRLVTTETAAGGVRDVDGRAALVAGLDLHRGVHARRRRAADQQRDVEAFAFHLPADVDHLVERRGDQAGQADDVRVLLAGHLEDLLRSGPSRPRSTTS